MRKWLGVGLLAAVALGVLAIPTLLGRDQGAPAVGWPSLDSLLVSRRRTPPLVAGPKEPPVPQVRADEEVLPTVRGSYCWTSGDAALCADSIEPASLILGFGRYTPVRPGARIRVAFPGALLAGSLSVTDHSGAKEPTPITLDAEGSFAAPTQAGTYLYLIHGRFPQGDASYALGIEVYDERLEPPPILVLVDGKPVATVRGSACWSSGTESLCTDRLGPAEQLAGRSIIPVRKAGAQVQISFVQPPDRTSLYLRTSEGRQEVPRAADGSFQLPAGPGTYIYEVDGTWSQGSGSYGFAVKVD